MFSWSKTYKFYRIAMILLIASSSIGFNLLVTVDVTAQTAINENELVNAHNNARLEQGLEPLRINPILSQSAQNKAEAMLQENCWSHFCPPGKAPWDYMEEVGYEYIIAGENLAEGFIDTNIMMQAWLISPTHQENIMRTDYSEIGIGIATGNFQGKSDNIVVAVHFGSPSLSVLANDSTDKLLLIENPITGQIIEESELEVEGIAVGIEQVDLYFEETYQGTNESPEGLFFFQVESIPDGEYEITVEDSSNELINDTVSVRVNTEGDIFTDTGEIQLASVSPTTRNGINIAFLVALFSIFMFDLIMLRFTKLADHGDLVQNNEQHHGYHLGLILIIIIVVVTGGLTGSVGSDALQITL